MTRRYQVAEFFAGIGLVRLALDKLGWQVAFANDIDADKFAMYQANFGPEHFVLGDIHKLSADQIPTCDLFTASFPCNDLSIAGARAGSNGMTWQANEPRCNCLGKGRRCRAKLSRPGADRN